MSDNMDNENLNDLISKFYPPEQVARIKEDICKGDEIIVSGGRLQPDAAVISEIKNTISAKLTARKSRRINTISLKAAVAAMIAIVAFLGVRTMIHQRGSTMPAGVAISSFWGEDATASIIADELDEIENTIISISLDELETESDIAVDSLELEINETGSDFWRS